MPSAFSVPKRVFDLAQAAVDVGQRAVWRIGRSGPCGALKLRHRLVAFARQRVRGRRIAEPHVRRADRQHRHRDAVLIHGVEGLARLPFGEPVVERVRRGLQHRAGLVRRRPAGRGGCACRCGAGPFSVSSAGFAGIELSQGRAYQFGQGMGGGVRLPGETDDHRWRGYRHQGGAERDRARARPAVPRGHVGAGAPPPRLRPRGEADRGGIPAGRRLSQLDRPRDQRLSQRGGADVGLARRVDAGLPAQQRRRRRDRDHRQPARPVLAPRLAAAPRTAARSCARRRRGRSCSVNVQVQDRDRQAGGRRRGRRLAVLDRRPVREPGPDPGRHEPARQVQDRQRRPLLVPQRSSRRATRSRSTGRSAICCARKAATTCGRRICTS